MLDAPGDEDQAGLGKGVSLSTDEKLELAAQLPGIVPVRAGKADHLVEVVGMGNLDLNRLATGQAPQDLAAREERAPGHDRAHDAEQHGAVEDLALPSLIFHFLFPLTY